MPHSNLSPPPHRPSPSDEGVAAAPTFAGTAVTVRVWDLPVRLFHWSLLVCIIGAYVTMEVLEDMTAWHFRFGYAIVALVLFRVLWGLFGDRYSRFSSFPPSPQRILRYLKGGDAAVPTLGHNPLGSLSVYGLLLVVAMQGVTGLMSSDDIADEGPLVRYLSSGVVEWMTKIHHLNFNLLQALIVLHVLAIVGYRIVKKRRLVATMVTGDRHLDREPLPAGVSLPAATDSVAVRVRALVLFAIAVAVVAFVVYYRPATATF